MSTVILTSIAYLFKKMAREYQRVKDQEADDGDEHFQDANKLLPQ